MDVGEGHQGKMGRMKRTNEKKSGASPNNLMQPSRARCSGKTCTPQPECGLHQSIIGRGRKSGREATHHGQVSDSNMTMQRTARPVRPDGGTKSSLK